MTIKPYKEKKEEREERIVEHIAALKFSGLSESEAQSSAMKKFEIYSRTTIWSIKKRVAKRAEESKN